MKTVIYPEKKTFFPFGEDMILGFLGETEVPNWKQPGTEEDTPAITGYAYTGPRSDGGTLMPCADPSNYGDVANAIIRSRYSMSEELAIHRHYAGDPENHASEWAEYNAFCESAKTLAKNWLDTE